jgi:hypothetical protein
MSQPLSSMFRFARTLQPVAADLLTAAAAAIAGLAEPERTNTASRVAAILQTMDAHKVPSENRGDVLMGIQLRLEAVARALAGSPFLSHLVNEEQHGGKALRGRRSCRRRGERPAGHDGARRTV